MLTPAQRTTLRAHIDATPDLQALYTIGDLSGLADLLNATATPAFVVWRTRVTRAEIMQNGFDWVRVDNLSVGKARIWEWMFLDGPINPSKPNIQAGIAESWKGTQADLDVRAAVLAHCRRSASRVEKLFSTGVGTDANPATMAVEGPLNYTELIGL